MKTLSKAWGGTRAASIGAVLSLAALAGPPVMRGPGPADPVPSPDSPRAGCFAIEEIIDRTGDGLGHDLDMPSGLAVDAAGNVYVTGFLSDNAFRIGPDGRVTEILGTAPGERAATLVGGAAVALDGAGRPYFASHLGDRVLALRGDAMRATTVLAADGDDAAARALAGPSDLAFDASGNLVVAGYLSNNVLLVAPDGSVVEIADASGDLRGGTLFGPDSVAIDSAGNVWVAARHSDAVFRIAPHGAVTQVLDASGDGVHPLASPTGLAIDADDNVYVAGAESHNVFRVAVGGTVELVLDAGGTERGYALLGPADLAVDPSGAVWVAGAESHNVLRVAPDGTVEEIAGAAGDGGLGALLAPARLAIDAAGTVYVAGRDSDNVLRMRPRAGDESCDGFDDDCAGAVDEDCAARSAEAGPAAADRSAAIRPRERPTSAAAEQRLDVCTPTVAIQQIASAAGDGTTPLTLPRIKGLDAAGNVYVAAEGADDLFRITAAGLVQRILAPSGDGAHPFAGLDPLDGFAVDPATGNVFAAGTTSNNVFRVTPAGAVTRALSAAGDGAHALASPLFMTVSGGNLYVAGQDSDNVFRITPGGAVSQIIGPAGDGTNPLDEPGWVGADAAGNVYVAGIASGNVFRVTPGGVVTRLVGPAGDGTHALVGLARGGFAVDAAGNLWVAGQTSVNVLRVSAQGAVTQVLDASGDGAHALGLPGSLALDGAGNLYVFDDIDPFFGSAVFRVSPAGGATRIIDPAGDGVHGLFSGFSGVADPEGNFYVGGFDSVNVFRIAPSGVVSQLIDGSGDGTHPLAGPVPRLAVDAAGSVYVAGRDSNNVFRVVPAADASCNEADDDCDGATDEEFVAVQTVCGRGECAGNAGLLSCEAGQLVNTCDPFAGADPGDPSCDGLDQDCDGGIDEDYPVSVTSCGAGECLGEGAAVCINGSLVDTCYVPGDGVSRVLGAAGDGTTPLALPRIKGVDAAGNLYVASEGSDDLFRVTPAGAVTRVLGTEGDGVHPFAGLDALDGFAVDSATGDVYVAGTASDNVFRVTPAGVVTRIIDAAGDGVHGLDAPLHVAVGGGNVYVAGRISDNVFRIEPGGTVTEIIGPAGSGAETLDEPGWLGVDGTDNVYVAGLASGNVFRVAPGGAVTPMIGPAGDGTDPLAGLAPGGFAVDAPGNLFVAGQASVNVFRVDGAGVVTRMIDATGDGTQALGIPGELVLDAFGNLYVFDELDPFFGSAVFRVSPGGAVTRIIDAAGDGIHALVSGFSGVADAVGNFYVGGFDSVNVFRVAPTGQITQVIDGSGDGTNPLSGPVPRLVVDAAGNLYVAGRDSDNVFRVPPGRSSDADGDGVGACQGDCDEADAATFPGAFEVNDGLDNQCPGDVGYGSIDEISGNAGFTTADNKSRYSWPAQGAATMYEVARSSTRTFSGGCAKITTPSPVIVDSQLPSPGQAFYYLVRALAPFPGSWGRNSAGAERVVSCP